jgi:TIGR03009 family protein
MRHYSVALLGVLAFAAATPAQQAAPQGRATGTAEELNGHLAQWEREMTGVKSLSAQLKRTDVNLVRNNRSELAGEVRCLKVEATGGKVDKLAMLRLGPKENPTEKYICTGDLLYRFSPSDKTIYIHRLRGQVSDDSFLDFLFQFKADSMKKRYDLTLSRPDDPNYIYLDIKPHLEADKAEFQRARLVLFKRNYLPAQLWFEEPNGNQHNWDLSQVKANDPDVKRTEFVAPEKPDGWSIKEAKAAETEARPRVIRPSGK